MKVSERVGNEAELGFTSLIDIVFLLLIFFMCAAQFKQVEQRLARLEALRTELKRMVHECSGGQTSDCRVLEVLRDHSECLTDHEEIGA